MKVAEVTSGARVICQGRTYRRPKVSIVTPTYCRNAEGLLAKCLDSAMAQTFEDFELIVVDDGSSDGSELTIREAALRDDRIVYIRHDRNSGLPAIRTNEGVMWARADAIAFLFDDNIFRSDFIQSAWEALEASGADVVHSNVHMLAKDGKDFTLGGWPLTLELLRNLNTVPNGGVMVRRSFFDRYGLYDPHILMRRVCDWDLWLRALSLGATFHHLDQNGAVEHGLVSDNSLGNTVAWDVKVAYGYMLDGRRFAERARLLCPAAIGDYDVLDPRPIVPYVRDRSEWLQLVETVYEPFLARQARRDFDPDLPSNRAASIDPAVGWNAEWALIANRRRYLVVSNSINSWASAWLRALRRHPGAIVVNCPEWQLSAFQPHDIDLVILMDCTSGFLKPQIDAFCAACVPILYVLGYGEQGRTAVPALASRHFEKNPHIAALLGPTMYFPQSGACFGPERRDGARSLLASTYATASAKPDADRLGIRDFIKFPYERVADAPMVMEDPGLRNIAYRDGNNTSGDIDEIVAPPNSALRFIARSVRPSWEGLGAVVESRPRSCIRVDTDILDAAPLAERVGLSALMTDKQVVLRVTDLAESRETNLDAPTADAWRGWIANLALSTQLAGQIARTRAALPARPSVAVFLNSEMFSGSEIYGLMIARSLAEVGYRVQVFVPDESVYGKDSDVSQLNKWLVWHGLSEARLAPYRPGSFYFSAPEAERSLMVSRIAAFFSANTFDVLICAGFIPVIAAVPDLTALLFMALFQPSGYLQRELAFLRGRISGFISDSSWSIDVHQKLLGGPGAVVRVCRAMLPVDAGLSARPKIPNLAGKIRVAIGGTLQPRKRQLQAVEAVRILRDRGLLVELNVYGYTLDMMDHYVGEIQQLIAAHDLGDLVRCHGLVALQEIAGDNDVVLVASVDESLPQTLVELMRLGLVGVAALSGGIDEVIKDGVTGYLTKDVSPQGLADALLRAIMDRGRWPAIAQNARNHIDAEYDSPSNTKALLDLLIEGAQIESSPFGRLKPR